MASSTLGNLESPGDSDKNINIMVEVPVGGQDKDIEMELDAAKNAIDEIDTIELAISEIVNQKKIGCTSTLKTVDDNLIEVAIEGHEEETEEENKARVALQQLESINSSSRRRKKHEIGSVVCTKKLQPSALDNDDLIAILQGDDIEPKNANGAIKEEVIIEGEGHFEVLDIVENDDPEKHRSESVDATGFQKNRKRKQDFKSDLVSSLASEWSDEEDADISKNLKASEDSTSNQVDAPSDAKIPEITPFKRTRVIKRKIIWDPDAPETQFSYASLIQPKNKISPNQTKEQAKKRVTSPVRRKQVNSPAEKKQDIIDKKAKMTGITKKKKLSEIDRLLGDEGAANMLNSLEQQAENATVFENKNVSILFWYLHNIFSHCTLTILF